MAGFLDVIQADLVFAWPCYHSFKAPGHKEDAFKISFLLTLQEEQ